MHAHMLTKEERIAALERVRNDQGGTENRRWKKDQIVEAVTDNDVLFGGLLESLQLVFTL